jgi:hypothetical protein
VNTDSLLIGPDAWNDGHGKLRWEERPASPSYYRKRRDNGLMNRLTLNLAIFCGILLILVAYLSLTVVELREDGACENQDASPRLDCS